MRARAPAALALVVALVLTRTLLAACRSDWFGGWGIGPRYLVAVIPFAITPLAWLLQDWNELAPRARKLVVAGLVLAAVAMSHLAGYSIFEHMFLLAREPGTDVHYFTRSHWWPSASPYIGFLALPDVDMLSVGSVRLARHGHPGMALVFAAVAAGALAAGTRLWRLLASRSAAEHAARHVGAARGQDHPPR